MLLGSAVAAAGWTAEVVLGQRGRLLPRSESRRLPRVTPTAADRTAQARTPYDKKCL